RARATVQPRCVPPHIHSLRPWLKAAPFDPPSRRASGATLRPRQCSPAPCSPATALASTSAALGCSARPHCAPPRRPSTACLCLLPHAPARPPARPLLAPTAPPRSHPTQSDSL